MNMHTLVLAEQPNLDASIAAASLWTAAARPLIKAMFAIEDVDWDVARGCDQRTYDEAKTILAKPRKELRELVAGIRDNFLCDELPPQPRPDAPDSEWQDRDDFQDELDRSVISADAFIKQMEMEA